MCLVSGLENHSLVSKAKDHCSNRVGSLPTSSCIFINLLCILIQVQYLRQKYRDLDIEVDGGVGPATIQACAEVSRSTVFLDNHGNNYLLRLRTTLYTKPTDSYSYLRYEACHPTHQISIPYSQFLRVRRNCFLWKDFIQSALKLRFHLLKREYPKDICDQVSQQNDPARCHYD